MHVELLLLLLLLSCVAWRGVVYAVAPPTGGWGGATYNGGQHAISTAAPYCRGA